MTVTEQPASAAAAAGVRLTLPGDRYRVGRVSLGQIVVAQLAVVVAAATYPTPDWVFLPVLGLALAVLAALFVRRSGRWWYQEAAHRWWYRRRARRYSRAAGQPRLAYLTPAVSFHDVTDRGTRMGVGVDRAGWYAAVVATPSDEAGLDLDRMLRELAASTPAVSALQLVHHLVPPPTATSAAGEWTWVAMRVARADAPAESASRGGGVEGVHRTLAAAANRVVKTLRMVGADSRVLISDELADLLAVVGGWGADDAVTGRALPEHWRAWHGTEEAHVCFRVSGVVAINQLVAAMRDTPVSATVAVRFVPGDEPASHGAGDQGGTGLGAARGPAMHGLLRVGATAELVDATVDDVVASARRVGATLHRLDGAHGPAIYAIAPTASTVAAPPV